VQKYASKTYIFRNLKEVSIIPWQSELSVLLINWFYDGWLKVLLYQKKGLIAYASQYAFRYKTRQSWYMEKGFKMYFDNNRVLPAFRQICYLD
jgi:hypothetical protein